MFINILFLWQCGIQSKSAKVLLMIVNHKQILFSTEQTNKPNLMALSNGYLNKLNIFDLQQTEQADS